MRCCLLFAFDLCVNSCLWLVACRVSLDVVRCCVVSFVLCGFLCMYIDWS